MKRYDCLKFLSSLVRDELVVTSLAGQRHEWEHLSKGTPREHANLYLSLMGHVTSLGLGLATALPKRKVIVIDSEGSLILNLGILSTLGSYSTPNLRVFVMDNECYEGTGGYPTATARGTDLAGMAIKAGIKRAQTVQTIEEFQRAAQEALSADEFYFVVAKIEKGILKAPESDLDAIENKYLFVRYIEKSEGRHVIKASRAQAQLLSQQT